MTAEEPEAAAPARPLLRVVSGNPSPEELAALVAVVAAAAAGGGATDEDGAASQWAAPSRLHRGPVHAGPAGS